MPDVLDRLKSALADSYVVEPELGRGGMAVVAAERFLREIKLAASPAHPHALPVIDSGKADVEAP